MFRGNAIALLVFVALFARPASADGGADHASASRRPEQLQSPSPGVSPVSARLAGFLESAFGVRAEYASRVSHALEAARRGDVAEIHTVTTSLLGSLKSEDRRKELDKRLPAVRAGAGGDEALGGLVTWLQEARRHLQPTAKVSRAPASDLPRNEASFRNEIQQHPEIADRSSCFSMCATVHANWNLDDVPCTKACSKAFRY